MRPMRVLSGLIGSIKLLFFTLLSVSTVAACKPLGRSGDLSRRHAGRDGTVTHRPFFHVCS
ncbi:hypothetical protein KCP71_12210 [Salmonella enterica subsp. enterica]|nr:hypothetical protein KCP71_12210 [Salmonella enterica subsp. enterica]